MFPLTSPRFFPPPYISNFMFFFSPLKPTKAKKENQDKLKKENTSKTENTKPKSASKNKTKHGVSFVLATYSWT